MNQHVKSILKRIRDGIRDNLFWIWKGIVYEQRICDIRRIAPRIPVDFRFGDISDIDRLDVQHYEYDSEGKQFARDRLQCGDKVVLGEYQGRVIFYVWLMFNTMDVDYRRYIPISSDRAYAYKRFTVKEHRGKNVAPAAYSFILDALEQRGCCKLLALLDSRNNASLRTTLKLGYHPIGNIYRMRLLSHMIYVIGKQLRARLLEAELNYSSQRRRTETR